MAEGIIIPEKKPTPPDTVFSKALGGWYDIVVVMYHDQGHIPLKVKGFVYNKAEGHWDAVADLPYSEEVRCYLACQMELELAMESLLGQLEAAGKLEKTLIVATGGPHPPTSTWTLWRSCPARPSAARRPWSTWTSPASTLTCTKTL